MTRKNFEIVRAMKDKICYLCYLKSDDREKR